MAVKTKIKSIILSIINRYVGFMTRKKIFKDNGDIRNKILKEVKDTESSFMGGTGDFDLREVIIETVNRCNTVCTMCPRVDQKRKSGIMPLDFYKKLIKDAYDLGARAVYPYFMGEGLVLKNFCDYAEAARDTGYTTIMLTTTGGLIKQYNMEDLVTCGLTVMNFSIDAVRQSSYEKIRTNMVLKDIEESIEEIIKIKNRINPGLKVTVKFMDYPGINDGEWPVFQKKWEGLADEVHHTIVHDWGNRTDLDADEKFEPSYYCRYLRQKLIFTWDGEAVFCCKDYDKIYPIGKYPEQSLNEIMRSPRLLEARKLHSEGKLDGHIMCNQCYMSMDEAVKDYHYKRYKKGFLKFSDRIRGKSIDIE